MMKTNKEPNRVWIELEDPGTDFQLAARKCALVNAMLDRLRDFQGETFRWDVKEGCYYLGERKGGGHWFDLDHLGRE